MATNIPQDSIGPLLPPAPKQRLALVDIAKGLGIFLIVMGHNGTLVKTFPDFSDMLMSFRLPFFFFVSGAIFSVGKKSLGRVAYERADAWLKPTMVMIIVVGMLKIFAGMSTVEAMLLSLVYEAGFTMMWPPLWFLPHLWLLYVFCTALILHAPQVQDRPWKRIILFSVMIVGGALLVHQFEDGEVNRACSMIQTVSPLLLECGLPFSADLLPLTAAYFLAGYFFSNMVKALQVNWLLLALSLVGMWFFQMFFDVGLDFNMRQYDHMVLSTAQAFCGIYLMLCFCKLLSLWPLAVKVFSYLGRASLFILIFHPPVQYKIVHTLPRYINSDAVIIILAMVVPIAFAIIAWEICKRVDFLAALLLPKQARKKNRVAVA